MTLIGNMTTDSLLIALSGVVIVFLMLAVLSGIVVLISRVVGVVSGVAAAPAAAPSDAALSAAPAPIAAAAVPFAQSAPGAAAVSLSNVDELTAACIMAIVSDETGIPPQQLIFKSIKAM